MMMMIRRRRRKWMAHHIHLNSKNER